MRRSVSMLVAWAAAISWAGCNGSSDGGGGSGGTGGTGGTGGSVPTSMIFEDNFDTDPAQRWMVLQEVIPVNPADPMTGWTNTVRWETSGGNPGGYRLMEHVNTAATDDFVQILVYHLYTAARYEPSTQGAIQSVSYQIDGIKRGPSGPAEIAGSILIEQGGILYRSNVPNIGPALDTWMPQAGSLVASQFVPAGLDFSASGEEMRFGYLRGNSSKWPITTTHGVDNWRIEVVPEP